MIYLVGGFMVNDNYGDVIQAKLWVDWYRNLNIKFTFICFRSGIEKCTEILGLDKEEICSNDDFLKTVLCKGCLHLYGGGYLNAYWSSDFIDIIKYSWKSNLKIFATGVQIDKEYLKKTVGISIKYISVRDSYSKTLVKDKPLVIDDTFGYFYSNRMRFETSRLVSSIFPKKKVLLQLSLNSYVYDGLDKSHVVAGLRKLIVDCSKKYKVVLCSSFPGDIDGILENRKLIEEVGLNIDDYGYTTTMEVDSKIFTIYKFMVLNSFHTYIAMINKCNCPIYYVALSKYYQQKAVGLTDYGMLDNKMCIRSLAKLPDFSKLSHSDVDSKKIHLIQEKFSKVYKCVEEIVYCN